jgi:hypothetical protein
MIAILPSQRAPEGLEPSRVELPSREGWAALDPDQRRDAWQRFDPAQRRSAWYWLLAPAERVAFAEEFNLPIDARIARRGGWRTDAKSNYEFAGMLADRDRRQTAAHRATAWYGCALCGQKFTGPHAVYAHLAKVHER